MARPALDVQAYPTVTNERANATMNLSRLTALAQETVAATQSQLPESVRTSAATVPVHLAAGPEDALINEGFEPDILGLFTGPAHGEERTEDSLLPPQIFLYLENLWDYAEGDEAVFRAEVRLTYLHELGHFLGWDETDLAVRGLE